MTARPVQLDAKTTASCLRLFKSTYFAAIERAGVRPYYAFWADLLDVIDGLEKLGGESDDGRTS